MKKKYEFPEENDPPMLNEPEVKYIVEPHLAPPLTEEEIKECMTGEEFIEHWCNYIDEIFDK